MRIPRDLSAHRLIGTLCRNWRYRIVRQVGSHVRLETDDPAVHAITIPAHDPLKIGTLNGILRAVADHKRVTREEIIASL